MSWLGQPPQADRSVKAARENVTAVGQEFDVDDSRSVTFENMDSLARLDVSDSHGVITQTATACCQQRAVGGKC